MGARGVATLASRSELRESHGCEMFVAESVLARTDPMLRIHGYAHPEHVRDDIRGIAEKSAALARELCRPVAWYREIRIRSCGDDGLILDNGVRLGCRDFAGLSECEAVVALVMTVGAGLDQAVRELNAAGDVLEALFLETAAWLVIEGGTKELTASLREKAAQSGLGLTRRFGPGYAGWPLEDHAAFFSLFEGVPMPVQLLESCAMVPKISRSGMYGLRALADAPAPRHKRIAC